MLHIADKAAFQNSLTDLPLVTYQPGETVIVDGSKTGRLLFLKKGNVAADTRSQGTGVIDHAPPP
jgi:hypothetical protein